MLNISVIKRQEAPFRRAIELGQVKSIYLLLAIFDSLNLTSNKPLFPGFEFSHGGIIKIIKSEKDFKLLSFPNSKRYEIFYIN